MPPLKVKQVVLLLEMTSAHTSDISGMQRRWFIYQGNLYSNYRGIP